MYLKVTNNTTQQELRFQVQYDEVNNIYTWQEVIFNDTLIDEIISYAITEGTLKDTFLVDNQDFNEDMENLEGNEYEFSISFELIK